MGSGDGMKERQDLSKGALECHDCEQLPPVLPPA